MESELRQFTAILRKMVIKINIQYNFHNYHVHNYFLIVNTRKFLDLSLFIPTKSKVEYSPPKGG